MEPCLVLVAISCGAKEPPPVTPPKQPAPEQPDPVPPWPGVRHFDADQVPAMETFSIDKPYRSKDDVTIALADGRIVCSRGGEQVALELGPFKMNTPEYAGYAEVVAFGALVQMRGSTDKLVLYPAGSKLFRAGAACGDLDLAKVQAALPRGMSVLNGR